MKFLLLLFLVGCASKYKKDDCVTIDLKNEKWKTHKPYYKIVEVHEKDYDLQSLPEKSLAFHTESIENVDSLYRKVECVPDELLELPPEEKEN